MVTIEQHNDQRRRDHEALRRRNADEHRKPTDIECPMCKTALRIDLTLLLTSSPPRRDVHCEACDWRGTVLA